MAVSSGTRQDHGPGPHDHGQGGGGGPPHHPDHPSPPRPSNPHDPHEHGHHPGEHPGCGDHGNGHGHHEATYCFLFDEKRYVFAEDGITPAQIRTIVGGIPDGTAIVLVQEDGTQVTLQEGQRIPLQTCVHFRRLPRFTRGRHRIDTELDLLKAVYPRVSIGPNREYLLVPDFRLPPGLYVQAETAVLVVIAPTYPAAPPDNFHVAWGLALRSGQALGNYSGPVQLYGQQWGTFSHHLAPGAWLVGDTPDTGSNLLNYLATVRARLQEGA